MSSLHSKFVQPVTINGAPVAGAKLYFYLTGTTTPATVYQEAAATTPHTNPVLADASGLFPAIFVDSTVNPTYKIVMKDASDITIQTIDAIESGYSNADLEALIGIGLNRLDVINFAELASKFVYSSPDENQEIVVEDDIVFWREKCFSYKVAAAAAGDAHLDYTGTGGVKLYLLTNDTGGVNVDAAGAIGDGATDDRAAIQLCIENFGRVVFSAKTYAIEAPLYIYINKYLIGAGASQTVILKTTTTVGSGSNTHSGVTDSYAKNAIIIVVHADDIWAYNWAIRDLRLLGQDYTVEYGIYAPRIAQYHVEKIEIRNCRYGFVTHNAFIGNMTAVTVNADSVAAVGVPNVAASSKGWADAKGFWFDPQPTSSSSGTSLSAIGCWARDCHEGWDLKGLTYSALVSCASDNITGRAYYFETCDISMSGSAMENVQCSAGSGALQVTGGKLSIDSGRSYLIYGASSGTNGLIAATDAAKVSIRTSAFEDFDIPDAGYNWVINGNSHVTLENSDYPSNGDAFISFGSGSSLTVIDGKTSYQMSEEVGKNKLYKQRGELFGDAIQESRKKAIDTAGTDIFTITTEEVAGIEEAVYQFRVVWRDTGYPHGMGIDTIDVICVFNTGPQYFQKIQVVNSTFAGSGITTAPTYSIARSGSVWTITMTPAHGDCTAESMRVQEFVYKGMTLALL